MPFGVENGAGIVFGAGRIWGIFPDQDRDRTGFAVYNHGSGQWLLPPDSVFEYLANTALSFQSLENGVVFLVGNEPGALPALYAYDLTRRSWAREPINQPSFQLGPGVSLAHVPNLDYNRQLYPVPGWLYCLPGDPDNPKQFWRYSIPTSLQDTAIDGISPGEGAIIADMTPLFLWEPAPGQLAGEYWLQAAAESTFTTLLVSVQTGEPSYQTEERLPNGTIHWRTAYRQNGGQWTWGSVHSFELQGGWIRLAEIPAPVGAGAALAPPARRGAS